MVVHIFHKGGDIMKKELNPWEMMNLKSSKEDLVDSKKNDIIFECWECAPRWECCFITTATTESRGLSDDCHELTVLRYFRDNFMKKDAEMRAEVDEYYQIAPKICEEIGKLPDASVIFDDIYNKWIKDAVTAVDSNQNDVAYKIYKDMVLTLKDKYLK